MNTSERFFQFFARKPEVIAQAPGRVNLIGEHIDYSQGYVLPFAIDSLTYSAIARRSDREIHLISAQRSDRVEIFHLENLAERAGVGWVRYPLGVIWALEIKQGVDIYIDGRVPLGAGLSSSAALECSIATALNHLFNLEHSLERLAQLTQKAENDYVGVPSGIMDQSISLMGKAGHALLLDCRDLSTELIPLDFSRAGLQLLIIDTNIHHELVDGGYAQRRADCDAVAKKLSLSSLRDLTVENLLSSQNILTPREFMRARHAVTEMSRVLDAVYFLKERDFINFGNLMTASHISLRDDYEVSSPELNLAVSIALAQGALGARMVGGGFGGSAIALIPEISLGSTSLAIEKSFADSNFKAPRFFHSLPSDGAKVIEF
jgi:galactokinase